MLITGGNSGTGYATAKAYYEAGAKVYIACRSAERANQAIENIKKGGLPNIYGKMEYNPVPATQSVGTLTYVQLDLSDFDSIDACAEDFLRREKQLDILFANAGIMATPPGQYTKQGYSLQFGTNVLGHQRLIKQLLPLLQATAKSKGEPSRLIVLSSQGHIMAPPGGVNYDSLVKGGKIIQKWADYGQSKWGDIALSDYVARNYGPGTPNGDRNGAIISVAIHPGVVATNLASHLSEWSLAKQIPGFIHLMQVDTYTGALNQIWASQLPPAEAEKINGKYISCYEIVAPQRPDLHDNAKVDRVWEWCNAQDEKHK